MYIYIMRVIGILIICVYSKGIGIMSYIYIIIYQKNHKIISWFGFISILFHN